MSDHRKTLGNVIADARKAKGLSQKELAVLVGYGESGVTITRIETGVIYQPSNSKLEKLAAVLDLDPEDLRTLAVKPQGLRPLSGVRLHRANAERRTRLEQQAADLEAKIRGRYEPLEEIRRKVETEFLQPLFEKTQHVTDMPIANRPEIEVRANAGWARPSDETEQLRDDYFAKIWESLGRLAAGTAAGGAMGAGTAAATYATVGAFATASTGTAISTLSGAAAANATWAALGGGSLATGGFGIAGGTIVLSVIGTFAAVPLLTLGAIFGGQRLTAAEDEVAAALTEAEDELDAQQERIEETFEWVTKAITFLTLALQRAKNRLQSLEVLDRVDEKSPEPSRGWTDLNDNEQEALTDLLDLAAVTISVLPLPVIAAPKPGEAQKDFHKVADASREWNNAVIDKALASFA